MWKRLVDYKTFLLLFYEIIFVLITPCFSLWYRIKLRHALDISDSNLDLPQILLKFCSSRNWILSTLTVWCLLLRIVAEFEDVFRVSVGYKSKKLISSLSLFSSARNFNMVYFLEHRHYFLKYTFIFRGNICLPKFGERRYIPFVRFFFISEDTFAVLIYLILNSLSLCYFTQMI